MKEMVIMIITDIESKILQLEPGRFQKMCNDILSKMNYIPYNYVGSQSGTDKTILGTPDAIFLNENNKYIYVEYTVQQTGLIKKIKKDVEKCLDAIKKENLEESFDKIIYMHSSKNITPKENEEIKKMCNNIQFEIHGIDFIANKIKNDFPEIAEEYLEIRNNMQVIGRFSEESLQQISEKIKKEKIEIFKNDNIDEIKDKIDSLYNEAILIINNQDAQLYLNNKNKRRLEEIFETLNVLRFYYKDDKANEARQYYYNNLVILSKINIDKAIKYYKELSEEIKSECKIKLLYANLLIIKDKFQLAEIMLCDLYYEKNYTIALDSLVRCYFLNQEYDKVVKLLNNAKKETFDKYGFLAAMFIISKNMIKRLNDKEILKLNNSKFKNMPLFYTATAHMLYDLNKKKKQYKEQFKKGIKYLHEKDVVAISTMCDEAKVLKLENEMEKYLFGIQLTPYLKIKLTEILTNKRNFEKNDVQKLIELRKQVDSNDVDIDYIDARILEEQGKEIEAIDKYEKSYKIKGTLNSAYKYIELSIKKYSKIKNEIIDSLEKDNRLYSTMLVVEAYRYNNDFENAIKNSYRALYLLNGKMSNKEILKQYWSCTMLGGNTLYRNVDYACKDVVVTIESQKTKKIKNYVIEDEELFKEGGRILNTEIIRTTNELAVELINRKRGEIVELKNEKYIIKDIKDKYTFFSHLCFNKIGIEKDKSIEIFRTRKEDMDGFATQLKEKLNQIERSQNERLDIYEKSTNIPLSCFFSNEKSVEDYAKIINILLSEKERCLYAGEPINIDVEKGFVIDLTSIIVLAIFEKLDVFTEEICKKTYITTSLKNKVQYFYENLLKKQGKKETTIGVFTQKDGEQKLAINETQINDKIEFWRKIYKVLNKFKVYNVEAEKNEFFKEKRDSFFDKVQFDLIELAKQKRLPYICDDLVIRKIAGTIYKVEHTNSITLIQYLYRNNFNKYLDEIIKIIKCNYFYALYGNELGELFFLYYKNIDKDIKSKIENIIKELLKNKVSFYAYIDIFINIINNLKTMEYIKIQDNLYLNPHVKETVDFLITNIKLACENLRINYNEYEEKIIKESGAIQINIKIE